MSASWESICIAKNAKTGRTSFMFGFFLFFFFLFCDSGCIAVYVTWFAFGANALCVSELILIIMHRFLFFVF